jgi:ankyrin repeat protein
MMSPIFYAIRSGSMDILKYLVEEKKVNIEKLEIQKRTPFYWACTQG